MSNNLTPSIQNIEIKGKILQVYYPYSEDFDPVTGALINLDSNRPLHYCILVKIARYSDGSCSIVIIPGTSQKINIVEIGKLIVDPDVNCIYSYTGLTKFTKFVIRPSNMMILKLDSKYFPTFNNLTKKFDINVNSELSPKDIIKINKYLNNPEIIRLINDLLSIEEGTVPENEWDNVKYIPINAYLD